MPANEVPSPDSPKAEPAQATTSVGGIGLRNSRMANTVLALTFLGGFLILGGSSATPSASTNSSIRSSICARNPPRLTPVAGSALSTLPPSHDNDVGRMRLPDLHPDADIDASQVPQA